MSPAAAPSAPITAAGIPITLADGSVVRLRYSMASLRALEADFGNVARIMSDVKGASSALAASFAVAQGTASAKDRELDATYSGPSVFDVLVRALGPGLLDARAVHPRTGEEVWLGEHEDAVERLLDIGRLQEYLNAFGRAFNEAFDSGDGDAPTQGGGAVPPPKASPTRSRGASGGTSRSAARGSRSTRSGG